MRHRGKLFLVCSLLPFCLSTFCLAADEAGPQHGQAIFRVRVVDKLTGQPIAGASVGVRSRDLPPLDFPEDGLDDAFAERLASRDAPAARANAQGQAICPPLPAGRHIIEAWADDYVKQWKEVLIGPRALEADLEFTLTPAVVVEGVVHDAEGKPLSARVQFRGQPSDPPEFAQSTAGLPEGETRPVRIPYYRPLTVWGHESATIATTDADGSFRLPFVPRDAEVSILASATEPGYLNGARVVRATTETPTRVEFNLQRRPLGAAIRGIVVDEAGNAVAAAVVEQVIYGSWREPLTTTTGKDGRFRLDDIPGVRTNLVVRARGFAPHYASVPLAAQEEPQEMKFVLLLGHRVAARVVDEKGEPVGQVEVGLWASAAPGAAPFGQTDDDGRFTSDSLPAACRFTFARQGLMMIPARRLELDSQAETVIVMRRIGARRIEVVSAVDGRPVREFVMGTMPRWSIGKPRGRALHVFTADGTFELDGLWKEMPERLAIEAKGCVRQISEDLAVASREGAAATVFELDVDEPAAYVKYGGRVIDDAGSPVADVELRLLCAVVAPDENQDATITYLDDIVRGWAKNSDRIVRCASAKSDPQGRFSFAGVPRTARVFMVWWKQGIAPGVRTQLEQFDGAATEQIELIADRAASVEVHVDRKAFPNAEQVFLSRPRHGAIVKLGTSLRLKLDPARDSVEIGDLPAGDYEVQLHGARGQGGVLARREFRLKPGKKLRVDLTAANR